MSVLLLRDRSTNLLLAHALARSTHAAGRRCVILDLNAFYAANSQRVFSGLPFGSTESTRILIPETGSDVESLVADSLSQADEAVVVIDNLNALLSLFSAEDSNTAGRKLVAASTMLSYLARENRVAALATAYLRERPAYTGRSKLYSSLGDTTVSVKTDPDGLVMTCERGAAWRSGRLVLPTPSC